MKTIVRSLLTGGGLLFALCTVAEADVSPYMAFFYINGQMGYEIRGVDKSHASWQSRLKFDMDNICLGGGASFGLGNKFDFRLGGWSTLDREVGIMTDIDWKGSAEVIWSSSLERLHAFGVDLEGTYWLMERETFRLGPMAGVVYDRFDFSVYDLHQRGVNPAEDVDYAGRVATYLQERVSLLLGVAATWNPLEWFEVEWTGSVSPVTYVWDRDNHLLRTKVAYGEGIAYVLTTGLKVGVVLWERVHVGAWADYLYMNSYTAEQDQFWYGSADPKAPQGQRENGVNDRINRENFRVGGRLAVVF